MQDTLRDLYGVEMSAATISVVTDTIWPLVKAWQSQPLADVYPIVYLNTIHLQLRRDGRGTNTAVSIVLDVDLAGQCDVLGHWVGDGAEGANVWLSVMTDLQTRGVQDILIACIDGLSGFKEAIHAVFPQTQIQRCLIHQVRQSLSYVAWTDRKAFVKGLKAIYQAPTREAAETQLLLVAERWGEQYPVVIRSWETNWEDLATMFAYPPEIRQLISTTNKIEGYNRHLRTVIKTKGAFPTDDAARKLLYLANREIVQRWTAPIPDWRRMLNQLAIRFAGRVPL